MRKPLFLALGLIGFLALGGFTACSTPTNPGPNPACASAATGISDAAQALGVAKAAWSIGQVFITNAVVVKAITTALDSASAGITSAQASVAAGNCDVTSYINAAVAAIQTALADISSGQPRALVAGQPSNLNALINQSNALANEAKAAVAK